MGMLIFWRFLQGGAAFSAGVPEAEEPHPQVEINISVEVYEDVRPPEGQKPQSIRWLLDWLREEDEFGRARALTVKKHIKAVTVNLVSDGEKDWLCQDSSFPTSANHHYLNEFFEDLKRIEQWVPIKRSFGQTSTTNFLHPLMRTKWERLNTLDRDKYSTRIGEWKQAIEKRTVLEGLLLQPGGLPLSGVDVLLPQVGLMGERKIDKKGRWAILSDELQKLVDPEKVRGSEAGFYACLSCSLQQELARQWMMATFLARFPYPEAIAIRTDSPERLWPDSSTCLMFGTKDLKSYLQKAENLMPILSWTKRLKETVLSHLDFVKKHSTLTCYWENWQDWDSHGRAFPNPSKDLPGLPEDLIRLLALTSCTVGGINFVLPSTATPEDCVEYFERFRRCAYRMTRVKETLDLPRDYGHSIASYEWCPVATGSPSSWAISLLCPAMPPLLPPPRSGALNLNLPFWRKADLPPSSTTLPTWGLKPTFDIPLMGTNTSYAPQPVPLSEETVAKAIRFAKKEKCGLGFIFPTTALAECYLGTNFEKNLIKWAIEEFLAPESPEEISEGPDDSHPDGTLKEEKPYWNHAYSGSNCYDTPGCREYHTRT